MDKRAQQIKSLLTDERFDALILLMDEHLVKWGDEIGRGENEFDTIWKLAVVEGKKAGLREFFTNVGYER